MTIAHVEKFAELVGKDPALYAKFGYEKLNEVVVADMPAKVAWMTSAVNEAKALGLDFNAEEALSFLEKSYRGDAASGELSDLQLEAVAGGKGEQVNVNGIPGTKGDDGIVRLNSMPGADIGKAIEKFFSGW